MFNYKGAWENKAAIEKEPSDPDSLFRATTTLGDMAYLDFSTRAVAVYGPTNASSGLYSVVSSEQTSLPLYPILKPFYPVLQ